MKNTHTIWQNFDIVCDIQWNLSSNLLGNNFFVWNRQVFGLYRLNELKYPSFGISFLSWFKQDFGLNVIPVKLGFGLDRFHSIFFLLFSSICCEKCRIHINYYSKVSFSRPFQWETIFVQEVNFIMLQFLNNFLKSMYR